MLAGADRVSSLGEVYGLEVAAYAQVDSAIANIRRRLARWLPLYPSLFARVMVANTLLSSCLWYTAAFTSPTDEQLKHMDEVVWHCLWRKHDQPEGEQRGVKTRGRVSATRELGGLRVIQPSVMIQALHARAVNLALIARGEWWTPLFDYFMEQGAGGKAAGVDGLLIPSVRTAISKSTLCSRFWRSAITAWSKLGYKQESESASTLALSIWLPGVVAVPPPPSASRGLSLLTAAGKYQLTDIWDHRRGRWEAPLTLANRHRVTVGDLSDIINGLTWVRKHTPISRLQPLRAPQPPPSVDSLYRIRGSDYIVVVVSSDPTQRGPTKPDGTMLCPCSNDRQGRRVEYRLVVDLPGGSGAYPTGDPDPNTHVICSCALSPLLTYAGKNSTVVAGERERSSLRPSELAVKWGERSLKAASAVSVIRWLFNGMKFPQSMQRPSCEEKWQAEVSAAPVGAITNRLWPDRWLTIARSSLSGPIRSHLWRLQHRSPPLLTADWFRNGKHRTEACALCETGQPETFLHLMGGGCPATLFLWHTVTTLAARVGLVDITSPRSRALGDIGSLNVGQWQGRMTTQRGAPAEKKVVAIAHLLWTELRGPCIRAIWTARCNTLHNPEIPASHYLTNEHRRMLTTLRYVAVFKAPPTGWPPHQRHQAVGGVSKPSN